MLFDSPIYFLFLIAVVPLYWLVARKSQNLLLLAASYFFYGWWDWRFLTLIVASTLVDFVCARAIGGTDDRSRRAWLLALSLTLNLGFLGYFKYFNFFQESFIVMLKSMGIAEPNETIIAILLPPGISFYTFQAVAYIVDVYDRRLKPADSLLDYALFISLFPHLIAGPIQRPDHLLPQVQQERAFVPSEHLHGVMLILSGLFRKCVIADNCALLADAAFSGKLGPPSLPVLLIGIYAFAWQIYGDFSGYSQIARGSAKLMGFDFMINFRQPYLATSLQEFWRRWHISLSSWLRDYLYIRLGGNRGGELKTQRNLFLTMLIGGFWHGAAWTYVIWGALHGLGLMLGRLLRGGDASAGAASRSPAPLALGLLPAIPAWLARAARTWAARIAVFHIVCLAWVFFRAPSVGAAFDMLSGATVLAWRPEHATALLYLAVFAIPMLLLDLSNEKRDEEYPFEKGGFPWQVATAACLVAGVMLFAGVATNAFIYFQF
jgi:D-alanyl-lipoteichoic acid acyltransferase DltB (MBOAT superfamily)